MLTVDGQSYPFTQLSERAQGLSLDYVRTDQEWSQLQHRYRQFLAMETTVVNSLKAEVERSGMEPLASGTTPSPDAGDDPGGPAEPAAMAQPAGRPGAEERPRLSIDGLSYDASALPSAVQLVVDDLIRNTEERRELEFRLRQLDAARITYLQEIRQELAMSTTQPLTSTATLEGANR